MKEKRPRNEVAWQMYKEGKTYREIADILKITRQRAWQVVQSGIHRDLVEALKPVNSYPHPADRTLDKTIDGE